MSFLELLLLTMRHGPRTCGPGFASFWDSTASRARRSTGFHELADEAGLKGAGGKCGLTARDRW